MNDAKAEPLAIPKHGDEVDPEIMDQVCHRPALARPVMDAVRKHVAD